MKVMEMQVGSPVFFIGSNYNEESDVSTVGVKSGIIKSILNGSVLIEENGKIEYMSIDDLYSDEETANYAMLDTLFGGGEFE